MVGCLNGVISGVISVVVSTLDCESGSASSNLAFLPKFMKTITLDSAFRRYNRLYFQNKVKVSAVRFGRTVPKGSGETSFFDNADPVITIDRGLKNFARLTCIVLLHEMVHAMEPPILDHGPKFINRKKLLIKQGAYDDLL